MEVTSGERCESLNRMARNWKRVTGHPEVETAGRLIVTEEGITSGWPTIRELAL